MNAPRPRKKQGALKGSTSVIDGQGSSPLAKDGIRIDDPKWQNLRTVKEKNVFAVDANSFFSKPSIRTVTGIEILGNIIHPKEYSDLQVPNGSFRKIN